MSTVPPVHMMPCYVAPWSPCRRGGAGEEEHSWGGEGTELLESGHSLRAATGGGGSSRLNRVWPTLAIAVVNGNVYRFLISFLLL